MDKRTLIFVVLLTASIFLIDYFFTPKKSTPIPKPVTVENSVEKAEIVKEIKGEDFYVLENDYLQLVFSSTGGSIAEINLPFPSSTNQKSGVKPIEFDKLLLQNHPENDLFPNFKYRTFDGTLHEKGKLGGYYPLLRRTIFSKDGGIQHSIKPSLYALNIVGEEDIENLKFKVKSFEKNKIEFEAEQPQRKITKIYAFSKEAPYTFDLSVKIDGDSKNLYLTSGLPEVELISGSFSPFLKYRMEKGGKFVTEGIDLPKGSVTVSSITPDWVCDSNGFFGLILDPLVEMIPGYKAEHISGVHARSRITLIDAKYDLYPADKYPAYEILLPLKSAEQNFRIFSGPLQSSILSAVDDIYTNPDTKQSPDYSTAPTYKGWFTFISEPFANFLFLLMKLFYKVTHSWGFSIILLTIALRLMLYPLNSWSIRASLNMQQISPQVKAIQERYKKDPKRAQLEIMNLYREKKINPFSGCLPLLIQMPFLIGMFDLLRTSFELRGVSFIPGWIDNLTYPDVIFRWGYPIFFIGNEFHLLPILLGVAMLLQQRMTANLPKNKSEMTDQQRQQVVMGNVMALVFTVMFYNFPSGLNIYWLSSMLLGVLQQWYMTKGGGIVKSLSVK